MGAETEAFRQRASQGIVTSFIVILYCSRDVGACLPTCTHTLCLVFPQALCVSKRSCSSFVGLWTMLFNVQSLCITCSLVTGRSAAFESHVRWRERQHRGTSSRLKTRTLTLSYITTYQTVYGDSSLVFVCYVLFVPLIAWKSFVLGNVGLFWYPQLLYLSRFTRKFRGFSRSWKLNKLSPFETMSVFVAMYLNAFEIVFCGL